MKIAINGALGRMGKMITAIIDEKGQDEIVALVERSGHPEIGTTVRVRDRVVTVVDSIGEVAEEIDIGIDFSAPGGGREFAADMVRRKAALLTGTTGLESRDIVILSEAARSIPVLLASNTSVGVYCLTELTLAARAILGESYDVEIVELHHRHKKDAPSGTAISIASSLAATGMEINMARQGQRRDNEVGIAAARGGEVIGTHTVYFLGHDDQIEITHRANSRRVLAEGAVRLAAKLVTRKPGLYDVRDLLR